MPVKTRWAPRYRRDACLCWKKKRKTRIESPFLRTYVCSGLIPAGLMHCCGGGASWRRRRGNGGLTRCGCSCLRFACARNQHHGQHWNQRSKNDQSFHSINCFFTNNSSQVALADVLEDNNFAKLLQILQFALVANAHLFCPAQLELVSKCDFRTPICLHVDLCAPLL